MNLFSVQKSSSWERSHAGETVKAVGLKSSLSTDSTLLEIENDNDHTTFRIKQRFGLYAGSGIWFGSMVLASNNENHRIKIKPYLLCRSPYSDSEFKISCSVDQAFVYPELEFRHRVPISLISEKDLSLVVKCNFLENPKLSTRICHPVYGGPTLRLSEGVKMGWQLNEVELLSNTRMSLGILSDTDLNPELRLGVKIQPVENSDILVFLKV